MVAYPDNYASYTPHKLAPSLKMPTGHFLNARPLFVSTGFCSPASLLTILFIFIGVRDCFAIQCILYSKPPCGLLILSGLTPTYKGLSPSGKSHTCFGLSQKDLYFWTFSTAYNKCVLHDAHAGHTHACNCNNDNTLRCFVFSLCYSYRLYVMRYVKKSLEYFIIVYTFVISNKEFL